MELRSDRPQIDAAVAPFVLALAKNMRGTQEDESGVHSHGKSGFSNAFSVERKMASLEEILIERISGVEEQLQNLTRLLEGRS